MVATTAGSPETAPGPRGTLLLGNVRDLERDALGFLTSAVREHGDVVRLRLAQWEVHLLAQPDHIQHVLEDRVENYDRQTADYRMLGAVLGDGLLTSDGEVAARHRRLMEPAFAGPRVAELGSLVVARTEAMLEHWQWAALDGAPIDVAAQMRGLVLNVLMHAVFGPLDETDTEAIATSVRALATAVETRGISPLALLPFTTIRPTRRMRPPLQAFEQLITELARTRRDAEGTPPDIFGVLANARDADDSGFSDTDLRDEALTLFTAGHETTASALSWIWYLVSTHPMVGRKLYRELRDIVGVHAPTNDDLPHLRYTRMIVEETLRLYPPTWAFSRSPIEDDEIGGYRIPARSVVLLSPYVTHRHPEYWPNPESFDPERWESESSSARPTYSYFPFAGGPRQCLGSSFAFLTASLVVATVARRFTLAMVPGHDVRPETLSTLRPAGGLPMTVTVAT